VARQDFRIDGESLLPAADNKAPGIPVYAGYDAEGNLKGVALQAAAQGYQDVVRILYGYEPACQCIRGIEVLKMAETPGIGDKIITDADFQKNFDALDASLNAGGDALANPIVMVKAGSKTQPWQIDAISGATITSKAVAKMLDQSAQSVLPVLQANLELLKQPPAVDPGAGENGSTKP